MPTLEPTLVPTVLPTLLPSPQPTVTCGKGEFFSFGNNLCYDCPAGTYMPDWENATWVESQVENGAIHDEWANQTSHVDGNGVIVVVAGDRRTRSPWPDACFACPVGQIQKLSKQMKCEACERGKFSDATRQSCGPCEPGQFYNVTEDMFDRGDPGNGCEYCPPGRYAPTPAAMQCIYCDAGFATGG